MSRPARFLVLALGWSVLIGAALAVADVEPASRVGVVVMSVVLMPSPLVAAVVVEHGLRRERVRLPRAGSRPVLVFFLAPAAVVITAFAALVGVGVLGGALGGGTAFGAGAGTSEVAAGAADVLGTEVLESAGPLFTLPALVLVGTGIAVVAGWTIYGLGGMGEEYGWRGLLWEEWRHLGVLRANVLIGLVWGLWHAPLVVQGHNYPGSPVAGVVTMVVFCTGASVALTALRELTGSVLPVAAAHGVINGLAPMLFLLNPGVHPVVAGPVGLLSGGAFALVGGALWSLVRHRGLLHERLTP